MIKIWKTKYCRWTDKEDQFIRDNYYKLSSVEIGKILNRDDRTVRTRAYTLGFIKFPNWTEQEKDQLKRLYGTMPNAELARIMNRPRQSLAVIAQTMGLGKPAKSHWIKEEDDVLLSNTHLTCRELQERFFPYRSVNAIDHRRYFLGIRRCSPKGNVKYRNGETCVVVNGKSYPEHRAKMVEGIGRDLVPGEVVHHINMDHSDNSIENLIVLSKLEHSQLHFSLNKFMKELLRRGVITFNREERIYQLNI